MSDPLDDWLCTDPDDRELCEDHDRPLPCAICRANEYERRLEAYWEERGRRPWTSRFLP